MPVHYVYDYEVCSLFFLTVIAVHFFWQYRLPNMKNKFFGAFIVIMFFDIGLDIASSMMIESCAELPKWLVTLVVGAFYFIQILVPAMFFAYSLCLSGKLTRDRMPSFLVTMVPLIFFELLLLLSPVTGSVFYITESGAFFHGELFWTLYFGSVFYFALSAVCIRSGRKLMTRAQYVTMHCFILFIIIAIIVQYLFAEYLLTGAAAALAIVMMYLVMQNPKEMLDDLTGLFTRTSFMRYAMEIAENEGRYHAAYVSLDEFRFINTVFGPSIGNDVLVEVSQFLRSLKGCRAFRLIGDQFAIVAPTAGKCVDAVREMSERFGEPWRVNGIDISISASICYITDAGLSLDGERVLMIIDRMIRGAKSNGRGTVTEVRRADVENIERELEIEAALRDAVENSRLEMRYQPMYSTKEKRFTSFEALVRFRHPGLGYISPELFIPLAEKNGLIVKLGEQVIRKVCDFVRENALDKTAGLSCCEINLSPVELIDESLAGRVNGIIEQSGIAPSFFMFEITETAASTESDTVRRNMEAIRARGSRFAMDDFGKGYANFDIITALPFDCVKVDRSMLVASSDNERSAVVFDLASELVSRIGMLSVIEGVETEEQSRTVTEMGFDMIQGYYYARPMTGEEFVKFINSQKY